MGDFLKNNIVEGVLIGLLILLIWTTLTKSGKMAREFILSIPKRFKNRKAAKREELAKLQIDNLENSVIKEIENGGAVPEGFLTDKWGNPKYARIFEMMKNGELDKSLCYRLEVAKNSDWELSDEWKEILKHAPSPLKSPHDTHPELFKTPKLPNIKK